MFLVQNQSVFVLKSLHQYETQTFTLLFYVTNFFNRTDLIPEAFF